MTPFSTTNTVFHAHFHPTPEGPAPVTTILNVAELENTPGEYRILAEVHYATGGFESRIKIEKFTDRKKAEESGLYVMVDLLSQLLADQLGKG